MIPLLLAQVASADIASYPDWECPPGSVPMVAHAPYCAPRACPADCEDGCRPVGLCLLERATGWGTQLSAEGCCSSQADCGGDAVCVVEDRCFAGELDEACVPAEDASADAGCGCSTASPPLAAFLGSLALLTVRRARRR